MSSYGFESFDAMVYNGQAQTVEFKTNPEHASLVTVSTKYYKLNGEGKYEEIGTDAPTNAGAYKRVCTISVKDEENYTLPGSNASAEFSVEFVIAKVVIELEKVGFDGKEEYEIGSVPTIPTSNYYKDLITYEVRYWKKEGNSYTFIEQYEIGNLPKNTWCQVSAIVRIKNEYKENYVFSNGFVTGEVFFSFKLV
jgi:hypothetical protein